MGLWYLLCIFIWLAFKTFHKPQKTGEIHEWHGETEHGFTISLSTRRHAMKSLGSQFKTNKRKFFLRQHTVILWNSLPQDVVEAAN